MSYRPCGGRDTAPSEPRTPTRRSLPELGPCNARPFFVRRDRASEDLDPGTQLDLPGPGAALLAVQVQILLGDGGRIEHGVGTAAPPVIGSNAAIDDDMADMNVLRRELAGKALRQAAEREFAHGERCGAGITLDACRGAGEEQCAAAAG